MPGQDDSLPFVPQQWFDKQGKRSEFVSKLPTIDATGLADDVGSSRLYGQSACEARSHVARRLARCHRQAHHVCQ